MTITIDRIQNGYAIAQLHNMQSIYIASPFLPAGTSEGDVLTFSMGHWLSLPHRKAIRKEHIDRLVGDLFQ